MAVCTTVTIAYLYSHSFSVTGETKYLDRASSAIDAFNKYLPTTVAFAALNDVNSEDGGFIDDMQSFWFAEVLKYLCVFPSPSLLHPV